MIYFIIEGSEDSAIKIGTAKDPIARLANLQTAHHRELRLMAVADGDDEREAEEHRRWRHLHIRGEWFRSDPGLLKHIDDTNWVSGDCWHCGEEAMFYLVEANEIYACPPLCEECFQRETATDSPCEHVDGRCVHCGEKERGPSLSKAQRVLRNRVSMVRTTSADQISMRASIGCGKAHGCGTIDCGGQTA